MKFKFGETLKYCRTDTELSVSTLAKLMGISTVSIHAWENETCTPTQKNLSKLLYCYKDTRYADDLKAIVKEMVNAEQWKYIMSEIQSYTTDGIVGKLTCYDLVNFTISQHLATVSVLADGVCSAKLSTDNTVIIIKQNAEKILTYSVSQLYNMITNNGFDLGAPITKKNVEYLMFDNNYWLHELEKILSLLPTSDSPKGLQGDEIELSTLINHRVLGLPVKVDNLPNIIPELESLLKKLTA